MEASMSVLKAQAQRELVRTVPTTLGVNDSAFIRPVWVAFQIILSYLGYTGHDVFTVAAGIKG